MAMKRWTIIFSIIFTAALMIPGLSFSAEKLVFGLSISTQVNPFYKAMADGVKDEAQKMGIEAYVLSADDKLEKQISDVEDLIQKKINVLLINATQAGAQAVIEKAGKANIKVITLQRQIPSAAVSSHIGTDNVVIGQLGAEWLAGRLGGKGNVVVLEGIPGAASSEDRKKGAAEVFPKYSGIKVVAQQTAEYDRVKALHVMENILQAQPKIDAVYCFNDEMAMGALSAVKAAKRADIMITGMDANKDAVESVKKGELTMTIALPPYDIGRLGVIYGKWLMTGEMSVPVKSVMPVNFVTK
jgi:ribose transport system substrate-binding protein